MGWILEFRSKMRGSALMRRGRADLGGQVAVQGHHPRRRDQHALAGLGAVDPRFGQKRYEPRR